MADKDDKEDNSSKTSGSMSSSLSDSWSVVNRQGDVMEDDSCSTSSVEIVEEEDQDESQTTSLGTSPSLATPTAGPLFVLRLSSHDVSDTDDDQPSSNVTDNSVRDSQSFDILASQQASLPDQGESANQEQASSQEQKRDETGQARCQSVERHSPAKVEEEVESLVKAIDDIQTNLTPGGAVAGGGDSLNTEPQSGKARVREDLAQQKDDTDVLPETVRSRAEVEGMEESLSSNFSFLGTDRADGTWQERNNLETSESTIMDESMERADNAGNLTVAEREETQEPDLVDADMEEDEENEPRNKRHWFGKVWRYLFRAVKWVIENIVLGSDRLSPYFYIYRILLCLIVLMGGMSVMYTRHTVVQVKDDRCLEHYLDMREDYYECKDKLERCSQQVRFKRDDSTCDFLLHDAEQMMLEWNKKQPDGIQEGVENFIKEYIPVSIQEQSGHRGLKGKAKKEFAIQTAYMLKQIVTENVELKQSLADAKLQVLRLQSQVSQDEDLKVFACNGENPSKQKDRTDTYNDGVDKDTEDKVNTETLKGDAADNAKGANAGQKETTDNDDTDEQILLDECLDIVVKVYQKKFQDNFDEMYRKQYEWADYGSKTIQGYLFGYLPEILPENLMQFLQKVSGFETHDNPTNDMQETSKFSSQQETRNSDRSQQGTSDSERSQQETRNSGRSRQGTSDSDRSQQETRNSGRSQQETSDLERSQQGTRGSERSQQTQQESSESNDDRKKTEEDQTFSYSEQWTAKVLEIMNRTRSELQDTWEQVKNASEEMWLKHEPAITKLQHTFTRKLQHLSERFQDKLTKKVKKWFYKATRRHGRNAEKDKHKRPFAGTKRREEHRGQEKNKPVITRADIMDVYQSVSNLNINTFSRMNKPDKILKQLERKRRKFSFQVGSPVTTWLGCQIDWWSNNVAKPEDMPQYVITDYCFDSFECWQVEVSEGEYGIGQKKCQKIKQATGNFIFKDHDEEPDDDLDDVDEVEQNEDKNSNDRSILDDEIDADEFGHEEIENWFMRRAEMRKYHHDEPDEWYFRRYKKWNDGLNKVFDEGL